MTILGVILCLDETHLTNFSGDKSVHAVYMTLGNIRSSTHRKVSKGVWMMLAKIPTSKFPKTTFPTKVEEECMPGILQ
jgi:Plavaka transposase